MHNTDFRYISTRILLATVRVELEIMGIFTCMREKVAVRRHKSYLGGRESELQCSSVRKTNVEEGRLSASSPHLKFTVLEGRPNKEALKMLSRVEEVEEARREAPRDRTGRLLSRSVRNFHLQNVVCKDSTAVNP